MRMLIAILAAGTIAAAPALASDSSHAQSQLAKFNARADLLQQRQQALEDKQQARQDAGKAPSDRIAMHLDRVNSVLQYISDKENEINMRHDKSN